MKSKTLTATGILVAVSATPLAAQTTYVWDNGAGTNNISTGTNWNPDGVPTSTSSAGSSDTARWDGSVAGNLSLTMSGAFGGGGGTAGIIFDVTSAQTGNLTISGNTIRVHEISVASGAGAVQVGAVQIGGRSGETSHSIAINASGGMSQGNLLKGGGGTRNTTISGTGDYTINGVINPSQTTDSNGFNITKNGAGTLFLTGDSFNQTNVWNSSLSITNGAVRVSNGWALGTPGSGSIGITTISGSNNTGRLELIGGISVAETITLNAKNTGIGDHLVNAGGNNSLTGSITWSTGGLAYGIRSDAGSLTITGGISPAGASKTLAISGAGDVNLTGAITDTVTGVHTLDKADGGTLTLGGANTYSGATTVTGGTLMANNSSGSATGSGTVSISSGATLGGTGAIAGTVNVSGILSPGASIQTFSTGTLSLNNGSTFAAEIDSSATLTVGADLQRVLGDLNLTGTVSLTLDDLAITGIAYSEGTSFSLINYSGSWNGGLFSFGGDTLSNNSIFSAGLNLWQISYDSSEGGSNFAGEFLGGSDSFVNITAIPEPAAALLGGLGLIALANRRRVR